MWRGNQFYYSQRLLRTIASVYSELYQGLPLRGAEITNPWRLSEFKADFDLALQSLGKGKWAGDIDSDFNKYNNFGWLQRIIIADIIGVKEKTLEVLGFYNISKLKSYAYYRMAKFLNGGENESRPKRDSP